MRLIMCCDYGLDDAAATCDLLSHAKSEDEIIIVAVGGNVPSDVSLKNAKKLLSNLSYPLTSVTLVDTTDEPQPSEYLNLIHGEDGMGDLFTECGHSPVSVLKFEKWLADLSGSYDLLSLGPLTLMPKILSHMNCGRFVFMGGNIREVPNFHGYEFNHALNRAAFSEAVKFPHVAITMDTCRNPRFNVQENGVKEGSLLRKIVNRSREFTFRSGEKGCYVWDDIAVKYLRHPDWFSLKVERDKDGNLLTVASYTLKKPFEEILDL